MSSSGWDPLEVTAAYNGAVINTVVELLVVGVCVNVVIDVSTVVMIGGRVKRLTDIEIIVETAAVIGLEFMVQVECGVEVLIGE